MPSTLVTRINLDLLYPDFRDACLQLAANCRVKGKDFYATTGFRSPADQMKLWCQGRTQPGKIVTTLRFGMHQLGLAVDWTLDSDLTKTGLQPSWDATKYELLSEEAEKLGLVAGGHWKSFKDAPHVEWPIAPRSISELKRLHDAKGIQAVWNLLDG